MVELGFSLMEVAWSTSEEDGDAYDGSGMTMEDREQ